MVVAHAGHFDPEYSRNRIFAKALRRAGATVLTVSDRRPFARRAPHLTRALAASRADVFVVGFPGHADVLLARLAAARRRVPVIFDAFVSLYETAVEDRGIVAPGSRRAWRYTAEDRISSRLADVVILDTDAHVDHFADEIGVPHEKLRRLWVGADDDVMRPGPPPKDTTFRVFLYSSFIPLHGVEHVVRAAAILQQARADIEIDIVGNGQTELEVRGLASTLGLTNIRFQGRHTYEELPELMSASHVCLGIFGTSGKASRVIPNKVFDALAVARPVITADTPAARSALTHAEHAWLCAAGDPEALAASILTLATDTDLRARLATRGHDLYRQRFCIDALSRDVAALVADALNRV